MRHLLIIVVHSDGEGVGREQRVAGAGDEISELVRFDSDDVDRHGEQCQCV